MDQEMKKYFKWGVMSVVTLIVLGFILDTFAVVGPTEKGIVVTMGSVSDSVLDSGIHGKIPVVQEIKKFTMTPIQLDYIVEVNHDGAITSDNQTVGSVVNVFYKYKNDGTSSGSLLSMYTKYGESGIKDIVSATIRESFKQVIGNYTIFDIAKDQSAIQQKFNKILVEKLSYLPILIVDTKITNYDWSEEFDKQIQQTMAMAQQVKQMEQEKNVAQQQAQKQVVQAQAEKEALIQKAEGEKEAVRLRAEAKALEGEGIRKYNASIEATKELELQFRQLAIESKRIDKWNGQYVSNNNYGPIPIQNGSILGK